MKRRNYLKTAGIAAGVLAAGGAGGASAASTDDGTTGDDGAGQITVVNDLLELSEDELWELPNAEIRRPFSRQIGSGEHYDADEWEAPEGRPHGGTVTREDADYVAASKSELQAALGKAGDGDVVWIPGDTIIDATGTTERGSYYGNTPFIVPAGVTVASNRGVDGAEGALLKKTRDDYAATFRIVGDGARITGLRFRGPETEYWTYEERGVDSIYAVGVSFGVWVEGPSGYSGDPVSGDEEGVENTEIDNCHFSGFIYNCVRIGGFVFTESPPTTGSYVHHCEFVDTPSPGLGYGITVLKGEPYVEFNYFDNNRHTIAGHGGETKTSYVFTNNLLGPRTRSHVIDCHGGSLEGYEHDVAGVDLDITNNVVMPTRTHTGGHPSIVDIRGVPLEQAEISRNWFFSDRIPPIGDCDDAGDAGQVIDQWGLDGGFRNLWIHNNIMGKYNPLDGIGVDARWEPESSLED